MKNSTLLLVFGLLLTFSKLHAQMELSAMLGYDAMKAEPVFLPKEHFKGGKSGYAYGSPTLGLDFKFYNRQRLSLGFSSVFMHKKIYFPVSWYVYHEGYRFNYIRNNLYGTFKLLSGLSLGAGGNLNPIFNMGAYAEGRKGKRRQKTLEKGLSFFMAYEYKRLNVQVLFYNGIGKTKTAFVDFKPYKSFQISAGYDLVRIKTKQKEKAKKGVICPAF